MNASASTWKLGSIGDDDVLSLCVTFYVHKEGN